MPRQSFDRFKKVTGEGLARFGISVRYVEEWDRYHLNLGSVHCGSQVIRELSPPAWWRP